MSGTTWNQAKVQTVNSALITYNNAVAALTALGSPGVTARVSLTVEDPSGGSVGFNFILEVAQATAFFTPVVDGLAAALNAQGVDLSPPTP